MPGAGTVFGGLTGATAGAAGGEALLTKLYDWLAGEKTRKDEPMKVESQVSSKLDLDIKLPPGVTAAIKAMTSTSDLDVDLGRNY